MDVTNLLNLIGIFTDAGRLVAAALAGLGFVASGLHLLIAHVIGSQRGQEQGKLGMVGSVVGLIAGFLSPQIMGAVRAAFGS